MSKRATSAASAMQGAFAFVFGLPQPAVAPLVAEQAAFDRAIRHVLASVLADAARRDDPLDRDAIAALMQPHLGRPVAKVQLDQWAAPSQTDRRIPVDALKAL